MKRLLFALVFAIFLIGLGSAQTFPSEGLVTYHTFDNTNRNSTNGSIDSLGSYNGSFSAYATGLTGILGEAYEFDGSGTVNLGKHSQLYTEGNYSISLWAWFDSNTVSGTLWSRMNGTSPWGSGADFLWTGKGDTNVCSAGDCSIEAVATRPSANYIAHDTTGNVITGRWYHVVVTSDGSFLKLYVNGTLKNSTAVSGLTTNIADFVIGGHDISWATIGDFDGKMDEFGFWNVTLNATQVSTLYNNGLGITFGGSTFGSVILNSPADDSSTTETTLYFSANVSSSATKQLSNATLTLWYPNSSVYKTNYTSLSGTNNITNLSLGLSAGQYDWNYIVYDNESNMIMATSNFTISKEGTVTAVNYENTTLETQTQTITLNLSTGSGLSLGTAILEYNGTNYSTTKTSLGGGSYFVSTTLDTPNVYGTINFKWYLPITDVATGVQFIQTSSTYSQTVQELTLGLCSAYSTRVLNFTLYNEITGLIVPGATNATSFEATFSYGASPDNLAKNFSTSQLSTALSSFTFCTNTTQNFYTDMIAEYSAVDYTTKNYYLDNATITNSSNNISLFLIPDADAIQFFITVKQDLTPVDGAYVQVNKFFVGDGSYKTVEIDKTDSGGLITAYLELDKDYRFIVIKDGEVLGTVDKVSSCKAAPCELELILSSSIGDLFESYGEYFALNVLYNLSYNPVTKMVVFDFIDTTGLATSFRMDIFRTDPINGSIMINTQEIFTSSGTLTYNMTDEVPGNYIVNTYIARSPYKFIDYIDFLKSDVINDLGKNGLILAIVFLVVIVFALAVKPILLLIAVPLGLFFLKAVGLFNISWEATTLLFILALIGGWLLKD